MAENVSARRAALISAHLVTPQRQQIVFNTVAGSKALNPDDIVIVGSARTPLGSFQGAFSTLSATDLGAVAIKGALGRAKVDPKEVDLVYMGNVIQANVGQAPARQAAMAAGVNVNAPATTINKVCASGMKSIALAAHELRGNTASIAVAGGMESMTNAPYYVPKARSGARMGNTELVDGMQKDGLYDPYNKGLMGVLAERIAEKHSLSKAAQDEYSVQSYLKATQAWKSGLIKPEIVPVEVSSRGKTVTVSEDEQYKKFANPAADIPKLAGVFGGKKTVTAGSASAISDGAAAVVLMTAQTAQKKGLKPLAVIRGYADAETVPEDFPIAPSLAVPLALKRAGLTVSDIDLFEVNEAFAVVCLANGKLLNLPMEKVNIAGGAISLGHPLGASGARVVVTLLNLLQQKNLRLGCAGICNGGGGASAIVIEKL
jgi:acetyl-CoA C-acetyltransferase